MATASLPPSTVQSREVSVSDEEDDTASHVGNVLDGNRDWIMEENEAESDVPVPEAVDVDTEVSESEEAEISVQHASQRNIH